MKPVIHPEMAVILAEAAASPGFDIKSLPIEEARRRSDAASIAWAAGAPAMEVQELTISGAAGPMRGRLYLPVEGRALPLIIFVHGGGWSFGSIDTHDGTMRNLAVQSGCAVFGFDYRLAPEHPFPAPFDDVVAAIAFALDGGLGAAVNPASWALAGDSAGATLALSAICARRAAGSTMPAAALLFYGCYAPDFDTESHRSLGEGFLLTTANMRWYWQNYLGKAFDNPPALAAPLLGDVAGLPPLYLVSVGLDPLRDDTLRLAGKLAVAGARFRHDHVPGIVHGCLRMSRRLQPVRDIFSAAGRFAAGHLKKR